MTTRQNYWDTLFDGVNNQYNTPQTRANLEMQVGMRDMEAAIERDRQERNWYDKQNFDTTTKRQQDMAEKIQLAKKAGWNYDENPFFTSIQDGEGGIKLISTMDQDTFNKIIFASSEMGNATTLFGSTGGYRRQMYTLLSTLPEGMNFEDVLSRLDEDTQNIFREAKDADDAIVGVFKDVFSKKLWTGNADYLFNKTDIITEGLAFKEEGFTPEEFWGAVQADEMMAISAKRAGVTFEHIAGQKNSLAAAMIINSAIFGKAIEDSLPHNQMLQAVALSLPSLLLDDSDTAAEIILTGVAAGASVAFPALTPVGAWAVTSMLGRRAAQVGSLTRKLTRVGNAVGRSAKWLNPFETASDLVVPTLNGLRAGLRGNTFRSGFKISELAADTSRAVNWRQFIIGSGFEGAVTEAGAYFMNLSTLKAGADELYGEGQHDIGFHMTDLLTDMGAGGLFGITLGSAMRGVFSGGGKIAGRMAQHLEAGEWAANLLPQFVQDAAVSSRRVFFHAEAANVVENYDTDPLVAEALDTVFFDQQGSIFDIQGDTLSAVRRVVEDVPEGKKLSIDELTELVVKEVAYNRDSIGRMGRAFADRARRARTRLQTDLDEAVAGGNTELAAKIEKDLKVIDKTVVDAEQSIVDDVALETQIAAIEAEGEGDVDLAPNAVEAGRLTAEELLNRGEEAVDDMVKTDDADTDTTTAEAKPKRTPEEILRSTPRRTLLQRVLSEASTRAERVRVMKQDTLGRMVEDSGDDMIGLSYAQSILPESHRRLRNAAVGGRIHKDVVSAEIERVHAKRLEDLRKGRYTGRDISFTTQSLLSENEDLLDLYDADLSAEMQNMRSTLLQVVKEMKLGESTGRSDAEIAEFNQKIAEAKKLSKITSVDDVPPDFTIFDYVRSQGDAQAFMENQVFLHIAGALHAKTAETNLRSVTRKELIEAMPEGFEQIAVLLMDSDGVKIGDDKFSVQGVINSLLYTTVNTNKQYAAAYTTFRDWTMNAYNIADLSEVSRTFKSQALTFQDIIQEDTTLATRVARTLKNGDAEAVNNPDTFYGDRTEDAWRKVVNLSLEAALDDLKWVGVPMHKVDEVLLEKPDNMTVADFIIASFEDETGYSIRDFGNGEVDFLKPETFSIALVQQFFGMPEGHVTKFDSKTELVRQDGTFVESRIPLGTLSVNEAAGTKIKSNLEAYEQLVLNSRQAQILFEMVDGELVRDADGVPIPREYKDDDLTAIEAWIMMDASKHPNDRTPEEDAGVAILGQKLEAEIQVNRQLQPFQLVPQETVASLDQTVKTLPEQQAHILAVMTLEAPGNVTTVHDQLVTNKDNAVLLGSVNTSKALKAGGKIKTSGTAVAATGGFNSAMVPTGSYMDVLNRGLEAAFPTLTGVSKMARDSFDKAKAKGVEEVVKTLFPDTIETPEGKRNFQLSLAHVTKQHKAGLLPPPGDKSGDFETALLMNFLITHSEVDASASGSAIAQAMTSTFHEDLERARKSGGEHAALEMYESLITTDPMESDFYLKVATDIRGFLSEGKGELTTHEQELAGWWLENVLDSPTMAREWAKKPVMTIQYTAGEPGVISGIEKFFKERFPNMPAHEMADKIAFMTDRLLFNRERTLSGLMNKSIGVNPDEINALLHRATSFDVETGAGPQTVSPEQMLRDPEMDVRSIVRTILYSMGEDPDTSSLTGHYTTIVQLAKGAQNLSATINSSPDLAKAYGAQTGLKVTNGRVETGDVLKLMMKGLSDTLEASKDTPDGPINPEKLQAAITKLNQNSTIVRGSKTLRKAAVKADQTILTQIVQEMGFESIDQMDPMSLFVLREAVYSRTALAQEARVFTSTQGSEAVRIRDAANRLDSTDPNADLTDLEHPMAIYSLVNTPLEGMDTETAVRAVRQRVVQDALLRASYQYSFSRVSSDDSPRTDPTREDFMLKTVRNQEAHADRKVTEASVATTVQKMRELEAQIKFMKENGKPREQISAAQQRLGVLKAAYKSYLKNNSNVKENLTDSKTLTMGGRTGDSPVFFDPDSEMLSFGRQSEGINRMIPAHERKTYREMFGIPALRQWGLRRSRFGSILSNISEGADISPASVGIATDIKSSGMSTGLIDAMVASPMFTLPSDNERAFQIERIVRQAAKQDRTGYMQGLIDKGKWSEAYQKILRTELDRRYNRKVAVEIERINPDADDKGAIIYDIVARAESDKETEWKVLVSGFAYAAKNRVSPITEMDPTNALMSVIGADTYSKSLNRTALGDKTNAENTSLINYIMPDAGLEGNMVILGDGEAIDSKVKTGRNPILVFHKDSFLIHYTLSHFDAAMEGLFDNALRENLSPPTGLFPDHPGKTWADLVDLGVRTKTELIGMFVNYEMSAKGRLDFDKAIAAWWARNSGDETVAQQVLAASGAQIHLMDDSKKLLGADSDQAEAIRFLSKNLLEVAGDGIESDKEMIKQFADTERPLYSHGVTAYLSNLGNVVRANTVKGNVRVTLTRDQKILGLGTTHNAAIVEAIQTARLLNVSRVNLRAADSAKVDSWQPDALSDRLAGQHTMPYNMEAHLRQQAELDTRALKILNPDTEVQQDLSFTNSKTGGPAEYFTVDEASVAEFENQTAVTEVFNHTGLILNPDSPVDAMAAKLFNMGIPVNEMVAASAILSKDLDLIKFMNKHGIYSRADIASYLSDTERFTTKELKMLEELSALMGTPESPGVRGRLNEIHKAGRIREEEILLALQPDIPHMLHLKSEVDVYNYIRQMTEDRLPVAERWRIAADLAHHLRSERAKRDMGESIRQSLESPKQIVDEINAMPDAGEGVLEDVPELQDVSDIVSEINEPETTPQTPTLRLAAEKGRRGSVVLLTKQTRLKIAPDERKKVVYLGDAESRDLLNLGKSEVDPEAELLELMEEFPTLAEAARTAAIVIDSDVRYASYTGHMYTGGPTDVRHAGVIIVPRDALKSKADFRQAVTHELLHHLMTDVVELHWHGKFFHTFSSKVDATTDEEVLAGILNYIPDRAVAEKIFNDYLKDKSGALEGSDDHIRKLSHEIIVTVMEDALRSGAPTPELDDLLAAGLGSLISSSLRKGFDYKTRNTNSLLAAIHDMTEVRTSSVDFIEINISSEGNIPKMFNSRPASKGAEQLILEQQEKIKRIEKERDAEGLDPLRRHQIENLRKLEQGKLEAFMERAKVWSEDELAKRAESMFVDGFIDANDMQSIGRTPVAAHIMGVLREIAKSDDLNQSRVQKVLDQFQTFGSGSANVRHSQFAEIRALGLLLNPEQVFTAMRRGKFAGIPSLEGIRRAMDGRTGNITIHYSSIVKKIQGTKYTRKMVEDSVRALLRDPNYKNQMDAEFYQIISPLFEDYRTLLRITAKEATETGIFPAEVLRDLEKGNLPPKLVSGVLGDNLKSAHINEIITDILDKNLRESDKVSTHVALGGMLDGALFRVTRDSRVGIELVNHPALQRYLRMVPGREGRAPQDLIVELANNLKHHRITKQQLRDYGLLDLYTEARNKTVSADYYDHIRKKYKISVEDSDLTTPAGIHRLFVMKSLTEDTFFNNDPFFQTPDFNNPQLEPYVDRSIIGNTTRIRKGFGHTAMERRLVEEVFQIKNMDFGGLLNLVSEYAVTGAAVGVIRDNGIEMSSLIPQLEKEIQAIINDIIAPHRDFSRRVIPQLSDDQMFAALNKVLDPLLRFTATPFWTMAGVVVEGSLTTLKQMNRATASLVAEIHQEFAGLSAASQAEILGQLGMASYFLGAEMDNLQYGGDGVELDVLQEMFSGEDTPGTKKLIDKALSMSKLGYNQSQRIMRATEARAAQKRVISGLGRTKELAAALRPLLDSGEKVTKEQIFELGRKHGVRRAELREIQEYIDNGLMDVEKLNALDQMWRSVSNDGALNFDFRVAYEEFVLSGGPETRLYTDTLESFRGLLYGLTTDTNLEVQVGDYAVRAKDHLSRMVLRLTTYVSLFARRMKSFLYSAPATVVMQYFLGVYLLENTYTSLARIARGSSTVEEEWKRYTGFNEDPTGTIMNHVSSLARMPIGGTGGAIFLPSALRMLASLIPGVHMPTRPSLAGASFMGVTTMADFIGGGLQVVHDFFDPEAEVQAQDVSRALAPVAAAGGLPGVMGRTLYNVLTMEAKTGGVGDERGTTRSGTRGVGPIPMTEFTRASSFNGYIMPRGARTLLEMNKYQEGYPMDGLFGLEQ